MAKMYLIGFEGFTEDEDMIQAYIDEMAHTSEAINDLEDELSDLGITLQYRFHRREDQNWNEEWESQFQPVQIENRVLIRAPFHDPSDDLPCTLVIEPKMSFGTGHHYTTRLMIREMLQYDLGGQQVLDMGCGTGVLAIYAAKMGAGRVLGVDKDQWAYENALENVERNSAGLVEIRLGDVRVLEEEKFDMILANITRNILVRDMSAYADHLKKKGILIVSGFLAEEVQYVLNAAYRSQLRHLRTIEESNWLCLSFKKP